MRRWNRSPRTDTAAAVAAPPANNTPTLERLFAYAREHQEQARAADDEIRVELWNDILDHLIDRSAKYMRLAAAAIRSIK